LLGTRLDQRLGKPSVIENRPGVGGVTGALSVARAAPDGYTILMAPSPVMAINVALHKKLPYDPAVDFVPVALVVATPYVLVVTPTLPVRSVADLVELAKAKPGQLAFASAGLGTPHHLFAQLFKGMTRVEMTHVPYRGSVPALTDVAAGHVQLMFCDIPPALGLIKEGKVRALGVSTKERVAALPDLASVAEQSLADFDAASWQMVVAPAATPTDIVERLHAEIKDFMVRPEIKDHAFKMGLLPIDTPSVASLRGFVQQEIARWGKVVERAGLAGRQGQARHNSRPGSDAARAASEPAELGCRDELAAPQCARGKGLLRPYRRAQGRRRRRRRGRDRGAYRRQRRRQVDADDDDFRQSARPRGPHHFRRPRHHRAAHARDRAAEDRAGAGRSSYLRAHDRDGELADGRRGRRRCALSVRCRTCLCAVSPPQGAHQPARRHALGRRTADAGDRARVDGAPPPPPPRRALARPGAVDRAPDLRRDQEAQYRRKAHRVPGGTERVPRLEACAPRLCHGQRPHHAQRNRARAAGAAGGEG